MQVQVNTLRETLELLEPVVPSKPRLEVLRTALIEDGKARATDMDAAILVDFPWADGRCVVPVKDVLRLLNGIPSYVSLNVQQQKDNLTITWDSGSAEFPTHYPEDYPPISEFDGIKLNLDERLIHVLGECAGYCSTEEARPMLTGVTLSFGDELEVAAADGFRMAYTVLPISVAEEARRQVIVPARSAHLLGKLWKKAPSSPEITGLTVPDLVSPRKFTLTLNKDKACFHFNTIRLFTRLIEGTPPNFKQLIPKETPKVVQFFAPDLLRVVKQMGKITDKVRLIWEDETLTVSVKNDDRESDVTLPVTTSGEPGRVALAPQYLQHYLKDKQGMVTMGVRSETEPVTFRSNSPIVVVIMPMQVEW